MTSSDPTSPPSSPRDMLDRLAREFCTLGPVGHLPTAPGTWGALAAIVFAPWFFLTNGLIVKILLVLALFLAGGAAASRVERTTGRKDPGMVVIDELVGQWVVLLPFSTLHLWHLGLAFVLFRLFDIAKPWPIRASEHWLPGGYGVMIDDVLAGIYGAVVLHVVRMVWG